MGSIPSAYEALKLWVPCLREDCHGSIPSAYEALKLVVAYPNVD